MAISAIWKRPWLTTFAPILISLSFKVVRPVLDRVRRRQHAQEIAEVVGERMKLEPHCVGGERSARQSRPLDRAFALLDPLLARPCCRKQRRAAHVRHDEADAGIKFSGMPLDLGDNPPRLGPGSGLIAEVGMEPAHMVRRSRAALPRFAAAIQRIARRSTD